MIIEPIRGDYHPFVNLSEYFTPDWIHQTDYKARLRVVGWERDRQCERKMEMDLGIYWRECSPKGEGLCGGFRTKAGLWSEVKWETWMFFKESSSSSDYLEIA